MKIRYSLITFFILQYFSILFASADNIENIHFNHIGLKEGLSHSTVFAIEQDQEGYMWFATYDGINRYDGYNFKVYRHEQNNPRSIASNITRCIAVDLLDRVWVGTSESLALYDRDEDCFINFVLNKKKKHTAINKIVPINKDWLMISSLDGVSFFDIQNRKFTEKDLPSVMTLWRDAYLTRKGEFIYVGANNALYTYSLLTRKVEKMVDLPKAVKIQAIEFNPGNDIIWIGTEGQGLYSYSPSKKLIKSYRSDNKKLHSNFVRSIAIDQELNLWVGTYHGLNIYDAQKDKFNVMRSSPMSSGNISQNSVRCIFKDSQNGMWLGTYWGGLNYYHPLCNRFKHIKRIYTENSISNNLISCLSEDKDGNIWIGTTDGGLNFYNKKEQHFINYIQTFDQSSTFLPFRDIKSIYIDEKRNKVFVGGHASGMMIISRRNNAIEYLNKQNKRLPSDNIYNIISDQKDGLWISTLNEILHYNITTGEVNIVQQFRGNRANNNYRYLFRDSKNNIWVGGDKGVQLYKQIDNTLVVNKEYKFNPALEQAAINCFSETSNGQLLIGTNKGIFSISMNSGECTQYTTQNGLPSDVICGILEDVHGRLWISSNYGITCMLPDYKVIRNFTNQDGITSNQFNPGSCYRISTGEMYFGGINGITVFDPEKMVDNPFSPRPVINKLQIFNEEVIPGDKTGILDKNIEKLSSITLKPSQNSFTLSFVVMNYIARQHNTFSYKLEGYDKDWYEQTNITPVTYSNLPAGTYTFYIKAANNDGIWNNEATSLKIKILPVWYKTQWALLIFILAITLIISAIVRFFWLRKSMKTQLEVERLEKLRNEEISQTKIRFYINISHELRTPLTLISAPLQELLSRVRNNWEREQLIYIQRNTNRLLHLVNQLMDYRRAELGVFKLQPQYSNAYKRILASFINFENISKKKEIDYNFTSDVEEKEFLFDENYLDLIVNNLLSNAFKYTNVHGTINVHLFEENNELVLQISDTGIGISAEKQKHIFDRFYQVDCDKEGSGIGLSLVERLISLHHGRIHLDSEVGKGSTFTVYIPQDEELYSLEELKSEETPAEERQMYYTNANDLFIDNELPHLDTPAECSTEKTGRILVVEDNSELNKYLVEGLSSYFNVIQVSNGQEAIDFLKNNEIEIDLILTDVMMPVMDGVKLCRTLKQNIRTCHIPVYMLSAKTDVKYQLEGIQAGAEDYISKPFSMAILRAKIQNTLKTRARAFEHYSDNIDIEPEKIANNSMDEELLKRAMEIVEKNIDNIEFSTEQFAKEMNMSRSNLHLKLKAITGKSAIDFIHKIRFNRACQLLKEGKYTVSEISFMVGYNTPSYFTARFKKYMGCLPTEYLKKN